MGLTIADRLEIHELYARYSHVLDAGDGPGFVDCFTEDGSWEARHGLGNHPMLAEVNLGLVAGPEALAALASGVPRSFNYAIRHVTTNITVSGQDNEAEGKAYIVILVTTDVPTPIVHGTYEDTLRKVDGRWAFVSRQFLADSPSGP